MKKLPLSLIALLFLSPIVYADKGPSLIQVKSPYSVSETTTRLIKALERKGMTVFARINHAAGAKKIGQGLRPTELVIFGNPHVGTLLMQCQQSIAIDLPQKALMYEDKEHQVWLTYNNPDYLATRHNLNGCKKTLDKISNALANFAHMATQ